MSWKGFTDFKQECITSWTKLFATNKVQFTDNAIDTFLAFVDYMSCSADTYVSLGGSNGCADQLTNWDGTQKVGAWKRSTKERKKYVVLKKNLGTMEISNKSVQPYRRGAHFCLED